MNQPGLPTPPDPQLDRLLSEIFLRMRQGRFAEARERLARAKELAPEHPAVLEIEGDLAFAQGRLSQAEKLYKQALAGDPKNTKLEEKYATALVKIHMPDYLSHHVPDDSPWSSHVARNPVASALQSALLPGLGQFFNGDWLKGLIVAGCAIMMGLAQLRLLINFVYALRDVEQVATVQTVIGELLRGPNIVLSLLLTALWVYAIIDAALVAKNS